MTKRKILFLILRHNNPLKGGVQRVCDNLAQGFNEKGYETYSITEKVEGDTHYNASFTFQGNSVQDKIMFLESIVDKLGINIIINANVDEKTTNDILLPLKGKVLIIGHYHNSPFGINSWINPIKNYKFAQNYCFRTLAYYIQRYRQKGKIRKMVSSIDCLVLLSDNYKPEMSHLTFGANIKMYGIPNPFPCVEIEIYKKEKMLLYVGRICNQHKRIHSLLNVWKIVSKSLPDWHFYLLGGGDELDYWKNNSEQMGLNNIHFNGFEDPKEYYSKARFLLMTSNYEGFPMTIVEAMQYGCIPVVFDSFAAVHDVIENGKNGVIIPKFSEKQFAEAIVLLSSQAKKCEVMGEDAQMSVKRFSIDNIVEKWEAIFKEFNV